ncbi:MAG: hypothetical protein HQK72_12970 [Desulfamplus sp.]|nr:hypothetical protein [Desulfamplus sp.]
MKKDHNRLFLIFFIASFLIFGTNQLQARSLTPNQPAIPMNQIDAESLILNITPNEQSTISPTLTILAEDKGQLANLFAMVLHKDWVILMTESGWKPYSGDITMFGQVKLDEDTLKPFDLDCSRLINSVGDSIDIFYGYEIEKISFLGNALHFQRRSPANIEENIFTFSQLAIPIENFDSNKLMLNSISDNCNVVSPSLSVAESDVGHKAQLFAAILTEGYVIVKTQSGWEFYDGKELLPFKTLVLEKEVSEFNLPVPADYYGEVFYYYAYLVKRKDIVGNGMRVNVVAN